MAVNLQTKSCTREKQTLLHCSMWEFLRFSSCVLVSFSFFRAFANNGCCAVEFTFIFSAHITPRNQPNLVQSNASCTQCNTIWQTSELCVAPGIACHTLNLKKNIFIFLLTKFLSERAHGLMRHLNQQIVGYYFFLGFFKTKATLLIIIVTSMW